MRLKLDAVSRFAFSLATCLSSGLPPRKSLELSAATASSRVLRRTAAAAGDAVEQGLSLTDGFQPSARSLPHFFIPVLRAGEAGGRVVEALQLIHAHAERLKPSLSLVRKTWLYPLICVLTGWTIRTAIFLYFGMNQFAWWFIRDTFLTGAGVLLVSWALLQTRAVREFLDLLVLQIPFVRETILRLSLVLFFSTFRLAYEAGGLAVITVFDLALATVPNSAVRRDLSKARPVLLENGSFADAFNEPVLIEDHLKSQIAAGAVAGHLGSSLEQMVKSETVGLELTLNIFNRIFQRLVALSVALGVVGTLLMCLSYKPR